MVACPLHKKAFSLKSGGCLGGEPYRVRVFAVQVKGDDVLLGLPPEHERHETDQAPHPCAVACG